ncbi:undecaprenyl-diphosphate phosphatase [Sulfolobus sp. E5-1-F]|uniref:undecaprenyl-diphosphate phosphatase n=1 Tax=Saccharolobus sp. E5-1-F TaxID=2663019 RepID=UPI0012963791|nr:undecaprenyl-diphosphate phosphatase [Sulfolobus sp. E5-1-F]QGA55493.1 undecaprenyl-diphosphate phosphatase [Sulfolobus sp. E5-1-F]
MDYILVAVLLGIVQGISEWLPISSKTQILLVSSFLLGLSFSEAYAFGLFMEIGTIFAAIMYFRKEIWRVIRVIFKRDDKEALILLKYLVVVTVITGLVGVRVYLFIEKLVTSAIIGIPMILLGIVLLIDGLVIYFSRRKHTPRKNIKELTIRDFIIVGLAQGLAALPGVSRSGMTTSALILLGVKPEDAFRLSFIAPIPAALGAIGVTVLFSKNEVTIALHSINMAGLGLSMIVATVISLLFINALLRFARTKRVIVLVSVLGILAIMSGVMSIFI